MNPHVYNMYQILGSARLSSPRCSVTISGARDGGAAAEWQSAALGSPSKAPWALVDAAAPLKEENMLSYCPSPHNMIRRMQCIINWCKEWRMLPRNEERPVIIDGWVCCWWRFKYCEGRNCWKGFFDNSFWQVACHIELSYGRFKPHKRGQLFLRADILISVICLQQERSIFSKRWQLWAIADTPISVICSQ